MSRKGSSPLDKLRAQLRDTHRKPFAETLAAWKREREAPPPAPPSTPVDPSPPTDGS